MAENVDSSVDKGESGIARSYRIGRRSIGFVGTVRDESALRALFLQGAAVS
jgi:hypothetical protein